MNNKPSINPPQCVTHKIDMVFDHEEQYLYVYLCPKCHSYKTVLKKKVIDDLEAICLPRYQNLLKWFILQLRQNPRLTILPTTPNLDLVSGWKRIQEEHPNGILTSDNFKKWYDNYCTEELKSEEEKMATSDAIKKLLTKTTRIEGV